ncbi:MAG: hypothetical protein K2X81_15015 [Candidatus Obscuribacterales bacterium]|nr:hypothetical protein [Candidatus Obscuribacterales bacterium]
MDKKVRDLSVMIDLAAADKIRLKEFMKQELFYYNSLVEGLGPRARTFPETLLALHKDWENLWETLAEHGTSIKPYLRVAEDAELPQHLEKHRKMILGRDSQGRRFLDEKMFNIMNMASTPVVLHPLVRRNIASLMLEFYKGQAGKLIKRNDEAREDQDLYSTPIDMLVKQDLVCKRHLQIPRAALNDVRYIEAKDCTEVYTPYSDNPLIIDGHNLETNNHWNLMIVHQQPGMEVTVKDPWIVDIKYSQVPYLIKYQDVEQPKTGRIFATMKKRNF